MKQTKQQVFGKTLSSMQNRHQGRPAAILGGGPSLPGDMDRLPDGCVLFSVNHHALEIGVPADYLVYNDDPESSTKLWAWVQTFKGMRFSTHETSDVYFDVEVWTGFYSSHTATWLALYMGCNPVLLCGMDCYQGDVKHCHPGEPKSHSHDQPLEHHLRPWREDGLNLLPNVERVRAMSGPLVGVFGAYGE